MSRDGTKSKYIYMFSKLIYEIIPSVMQKYTKLLLKFRYTITGSDETNPPPATTQAPIPIAGTILAHGYQNGFNVDGKEDVPATSFAETSWFILAPIVSCEM